MILVGSSKLAIAPANKSMRRIHKILPLKPFAYVIVKPR